MNQIVSPGGFLWRSSGSLRVFPTSSKFDIISAVGLLLAGTVCDQCLRHSQLPNISQPSWVGTRWNYFTTPAQVVARLVHQPVLAVPQPAVEAQTSQLAYDMHIRIILSINWNVNYSISAYLSILCTILYNTM